jgi:methylmalonyl-CoA carboxyltransferase large subunit
VDGRYGSSGKRSGGKRHIGREPQETAAQETKKTKTMSESVLNPDDLRTTLQSIQSQLAALTERMVGLEKLAAPVAAPSASVGVVKAEAPSATSPVAKAAGISEEEFLAISAALAAWLGVHAHIRQIRLIHTGMWSQQGRVAIQASHRFNRLSH